MHVVIMGCGRVGSSLARWLERLGHSAAVIDVDAQAFRRLGPDFHGATITGVGFEQQVLRQAGIDHADGYAAVSNGDNSNIVGARVARDTFQVPHVVARIYDPSRAAVYQRLGIPVVATVRWTTQQVLGHLIDLGPEVVWRHPSADVRLTVMAYHPGWVGRPIAATEQELAVRVPVVGRYGSAVVTTAEMRLQDHDELYVAHDVARTEEVARRLAQPPAGLIGQEA